MRRFLASVSIAAALAVWAAPALADDLPDKKDDKAKIELPAMSPDKTVDEVIQINGRALRYKATVGHIDIHDDKGKTIGRGGLHRLCRCPARATDRPVTFAFNGGPGAASVYPQPRRDRAQARAVRRRRATARPTRPSLHDNPDTWLDFTDLVFIDPVGTGFSRSLVDDRTRPRSDFYSHQDRHRVPLAHRLRLAGQERPHDLAANI